MSHLIYDAGEQLSISLQGKDTTLQEATDAADLADVVKCSKNLTAPPCLPRYRRPPYYKDWTRQAQLAMNFLTPN
jgi:hypothetical protein